MIGMSPNYYYYYYYYYYYSYPVRTLWVYAGNYYVCLLRGTLWEKNLRLFRALITLYLFKNL